ncbi:diiron oxygenase [Pseudomonas sp. UBA4617]|uniref:diiron oxygenase n=1 Tax=Pseudomonas sp. UBA4617 TaxID=1947318 RepID=UPI0025E969DD|nr:diiron oxygenase [Pseudomonas sp. UBA4617]
MNAVVQSGDDQVGSMLEKLAKLWKTRAAVNNGLQDYTNLEFEPERHDFSEVLLPFRGHAAWLEASAAQKSKVLSYAWVLYNVKTIYIETNVVAPACEDIIKSPPVTSRNRALLQTVMADAMLDEALHTRMSLEACNYIYAMRDIDYLDFSDFNLVKWRARVLDECHAEWQRRLTRFAIACASETLITDYLKVMAEDSNIQSICHQVTKTHAVDEWSHSSVFSFVAADVLADLSEQERRYFRTILLRTVEMFANNELGGWAKAFTLFDFPGAEAMLADTGDSNEVAIYRASVERLIERLGLDAQRVIYSQTAQSGA